MSALREAAVAVCQLWFTDLAPEGSQHVRKAMLDLRDALDATREPGLDEVWAEAESVLPEGWDLLIWRVNSGDVLGYGIEAHVEYGTGEDRHRAVEFFHAPTLAGALRTLHAALAGVRS